MRFSQVKSLGQRLSELVDTFNNDNLHHIAISNLKDQERQLKRWWQKKYRDPGRAFEDYTIEELLVERLEDYYEANPKEIDIFLGKQIADDEWDGELDPEHEAEIVRRLSKSSKQVDITKYQGEDVSDEEAAKIFESIGRNLPKSKKTIDLGSPMLGNDEFEETFGEG